MTGGAGGRACRVLPDVPALDRAFDYLVPDDLAGRVRVGTIVRVPLHGRRVRGWVVEDGVEPEVGRAELRSLLSVSSEGPPTDVVALTAWAAHRWAGPRCLLLRVASPPNNVTVRPAPGSGPADRGSGGERPAEPGTDVERAADEAARRARGTARAVVRWPPLLDRRRLVEGLLAAQGSSVVVVADPARSEALARSLGASGHRTVVLHAEQSASERTREWARATAGRCVVVGGRVAAPAPVPDLAAGIVVDDGDEALQEERVPTWHARDLLAERCARTGARFAVVSPAPSSEALALAGFAPVTPSPDFERAGWPRVDVVDRREEAPGAGLLSERLAQALRVALEAGGPAVCVLNRRGRARLLACTGCGRLLRWDREGAPLWAAAGSEDGVAARPEVCAACGAARLRVIRAGVTRVREELSALLGGSDVADVDAATEAVREAPLLVGTESLFHRAEIRRRRPRLVAFLDLDQELLAPRYRAAEQALWLMVRGARLLAGRPRGETRLLLQTRRPDHEAVEAVRRGDPGIVSAAEIERRRTLRFPPFGALAEASGERAAVTALVGALRGRGAGVEVLGPVPRDATGRAAAGGEEARGEEGTWAALVRAPDPEILGEALAATARAAREAGRLRVAVDPPRV